MKCRICNSENIEKFYIINNYPITGGPVYSENSFKVKSGNVSIGFCNNCGSCILIEPSPDEVFYNDSYTSSNMSVSLGAEIDEKMNNFIEFIGELNIEKDSNILEIGCYDGSLMEQMEKRFGFQVYGCEPCDVANIAIKKYGKKIINDYFSSNYYEKDYFDIIIFRNVLEHVEYPLEFLNDVKKILSYKGFVVLEIPDGEFRIGNGILGSIVPEHPNYIGPESIKMILSTAGFKEIVVKKYNGGLMARAKKSSKNVIVQLEKKEYSKKLTYLKKGTEINLSKYNKIKNYTYSLSRIYVYGANTCTIELLATNSINKDKIICVIDDDPLKWSKQIVNYDITVKSREYLKNIEKGSTIIICSYYSHEKLYNYLIKSLNQPFKILRLYPEVELIEFNDSLYKKNWLGG